MKLAVIIMSGGLDSTVLAHKLAEDYMLHALSFNYGQRHVKELECARAQCAALGITHQVVDITDLQKLLGGSALTSGIAVPDGHYAEESMRITVVPNRNAIMLAMAVGYAVSIGAECVAIGAHDGDHYIYPDCRKVFIDAFESAMRLGNEGFLSPEFKISRPFLGMSKTDIVSVGSRLGVDFASTWTCYKGLHAHCGTCGSCVERKEAFELAGVPDPTEYMS